jgi:mannose-6-phosphate isomerase class I
MDGGANRRAPLVSSAYFVVEMFDLKAPHRFSVPDETARRSVQILVGLEGCGIIESLGAQAVTLARGDAVVVPAATDEFVVRPQWSVEFLRALVPPSPLPEPETRL